MKTTSVNYKVTARTRAERFANRHGIQSTKGGQVMAQESFQFPHTPYYLAVEIMQDEYPNADITVKVGGGK